MLRLYYLIWMDCIKNGITQNGDKYPLWKFASIIAMSMAMTMNLIIIYLILDRYLSKSFMNHFWISHSFLPSFWNNVLNFSILFVAPSFLMNYILIFYKNRYKKLTLQYHNHNGNLFVPYFLFSLFLPIALIWVAIFLAHAPSGG